MTRSPVKICASMLALFASMLISQTPLPQSAAIAKEQPLHLTLLDGRNGKPIPSALIRITQTQPPYDLIPANAVPVYSDASGHIVLPPQPSDTHGFAVSVSDFWPCGSVKINFSFDDVRHTGTVSGNTCKPKITQPPAPGTIVLYVRPYTAFERMQQWR